MNGLKDAQNRGLFDRYLQTLNIHMKKARQASSYTGKWENSTWNNGQTHICMYVCWLQNMPSESYIKNHVILRMIGFFWSFFIYTLKSLQMRNDLNICLSIDLYS